MLGRLPLALLSLLLATVAHSAEPTTHNDPFRPIALRIPQKQEPPICCLKSPPPLEAVDDEVLLSFEEWKARQAQIQAGANSEAPEKSPRSGTEGESKGERIRTGEEPKVIHDELNASAYTKPEAGQQSTGTLSPHFRVPITDRFNYASLDCSARVHTAHKGAKSSSSILSSKKDRYMLSPCNTPNVQQFVVVELCEDIRIDTVQLANFEFFSGVFKDFSVSVAKTYNGPWQDAGIYRAKNIRGVQSFHTPSTLRDFYRYIRIDFHSHYGKEHYCPLSLLRVYGLTHLEEWKWELWEAESKAKQAALEGAAKLLLTATESSVENNDSAATPATDAATPVASVSDAPSIPDPNQPIIIELAPTHENNASSMADRHSTRLAITDTHSNDSHDPITTSHMQPLHSKDIHATPPTPPSSSASSTSLSTPITSLPVSVASLNPTSTAALSTSIVSVKPISSEVDSGTGASSSSSRSSPMSTASPSSPSVNASLPPPSAPHQPAFATGGESIYRTIMNRLHAIESSQTLYTRYIEQQNVAIRNVIKQLGEDIGRLEAATRTQRATQQKSASQWEKERMQMIIDYNQLRSKVDHLTEEIVLEKRLGVFQLCLLLAVLVFMGLTRGSRGEAIVVTKPAGTVREWGRRHLSLSGDWNRFMRGSRSRSPVRAKAATATSRPSESPSKATSARLHPDDRVQFPRSDEVAWKKTPLEQIHLNTAPLPHEYRAARQKKSSLARSRTPSLRTGGANTAGKRTPQTAAPHIGPRSGTPTPVRIPAHLRPQFLQRSSSHVGGHSTSVFPGVMVPKSAKKWARSAHLHPARPPASRAASSRDENTFLAPSNGVPDGPDDIFSAPAGSSRFPKLEKDMGTRLTALASSGKQKYVYNDGDDIEGAGTGAQSGVGKARTSRPRAPLRVLSYSGDDRDTESNWADTDSVVGSDVGDGNYSEADVSRMD